MLSEPRDTLVLGFLTRSVHLFVLWKRSPQREPVRRPVIHYNLAIPGLDDRPRPLGLGRRDLVVLAANGNGQRHDQLLEVAGQDHEAGVAGKGGVDEGPVVIIVAGAAAAGGALGEEHGVLAAPAEADGAEGQGGLVGADGGEEGLDARVGDAEAVAVEEGDDDQESRDEVVAGAPRSARVLLG